MGSRRSILRIVGGSARENPVPRAFHPADLKDCKICRPRRPVAPVTRTVLGMMILCCGEDAENGPDGTRTFAQALIDTFRKTWLLRRDVL